jgi:hypothetical protein
VVKIGASVPAPLIRLRAQPNDWHARVTAATKTTAQQAGKAPLYREFWTRFLERVKVEFPSWTNATKPQIANWFSMACPFRGGSYYSVSFAAGGKLRTELYIDFGDEDQNRSVFEQLAERRSTVEEVYGGPLSWEDLPGKRACRVADYGDGDVTNGDMHDAYIDWFFDTGQRLRAAIDAVAPLITVG